MIIALRPTRLQTPFSSLMRESTFDQGEKAVSRDGRWGGGEQVMPWV